MTNSEEPVQRRRVVLHPRTAAARRFDRSRGNAIHVRGHTVDQESVDELHNVLVRSSLRYLAIVLLPIAILMVSIATIPALRSARPFDLAPLPWFLIGPVTLFSIAAVALVHERRTARFETEWSEAHRENSG